MSDRHTNRDRCDLKSPQEIAEIAGISKYSVLRWARDEDCPLPVYRVSKSTILISLTEFLGWLHSKRTVPDVERIATEAVESLKRTRRRNP